MGDQPIELNAPPQETPITLGLNTNYPSPDTAGARAFMFQYGLGPQVGNKSLEDLNHYVATGREQDLRQEAASSIDAATVELRRRTLRLMGQGGQDLDDEIVRRVGTPPVPTNTNTVLEQAWAKKYVDTATSMAPPHTDLDEAKKEIPKQLGQIKNQTAEHISKMSLILKRLQDARDAYDSQSYVGAGVDFLKRWFPGYDQAKLRGWLGSFAFPLLPGDNMDEQSMQLLLKPWGTPGGFEDTFNPIMDKLIKDNPQIAMQFAQAMYGQSASERSINNMTMLFDIASIPGTGLAAKWAGRLLGLSKASADMVRGLRVATHDPETWEAMDAPWDVGKFEGSSQFYQTASEERAAQVGGNYEEAAVIRFTNQLNEDKKNPGNPSNMVEALTSASRTDIKDFTANIGHGGQELVNKMWARWESYRDPLVNLIKEIGRVETLPELNDVVARALIPEIKQWFRGLSDGIYDVSYAGLNPESNSYQFDLHIVAPNNNPFNTWAQAIGAGKKLEDAKPVQKSPDVWTIGSSVTVQREGTGWKVIKRVDLPENTPLASGLRASTADGRLQKGRGIGQVWDGWLSSATRFRTPKELLSMDENTQREIATHHPLVLLGLAKEALRDVEKLPKGLPRTETRKKWEQWYQALEYGKTRWKETGGKESWFKTGADMDDFYQRNFHRDPTDQEKLAYMAAVRNVETNRIWSTMREYSNKAKWGAQQYQLSFYNKANQKKASGFFDARILPELPKDFRQLVYIQTGKGPGRVRQIASGVDKKTAERIQKGELKVLQIYNTDLKPISKFINEERPVNYAIVDKFDTQSLSWENQIPRQGGGHFVYDYDFYIKQPIIEKMKIMGRDYNWYRGDKTIVPISIRASGAEAVKHFNRVRELLRDGKEAEAKAYHDSVQWDLPWDTHKGWYQETKGGPGVYKPAMLSLHDPIYMVEKNKTIMDTDASLQKLYGGENEYFRDGTREGNPARQNMVDFTGERDALDLMTLRDEGTVHNPVWKYEPARFVDAIGTMNRSYNKAVKSLFLDDMKNYSLRHWLTQIAPYMNVDLNTLMHSPQWYFKNFETFLKAGAKNNPEVNKLRSAKYQIDQFLGVPSKLDTFIHSAQQSMVDMLYGKFGAKAVPDWLLSEVRDPAAYFRSMVVHMKLGLFNIPAFFVQASTFVNVLAIAGPSHAMPGAFGSFAHRWGRINEFMLKALDEKASYFGWKPGELTEAYKELSRRGFEQVGHTHAFTDALYQNKLIRGKWGQILDAGQGFFREGAEGIRRAAWYTAYHEYRRGAPWTKGSHPTGALTKREWDRILSRAADLDHNMSRAANSQLQSGLLSFPMQFQAYHLRLMELMTGKRLTTAEKARLFLTTSIMYGLPLGGMGLLPVPYLGDYIRDSAQKNGYYVPGEHFISDTVMRGLPDAVMKQITNSNWNIAERWGTGKFDMLDAFGNESFWQVVGGASGSTLLNTWKNAHPLIKAGYAAITGDYADYPIVASDVLDLLTNEISSGSNIKGFLNTIHTGHLLSKNGTFLSDVDKAKWSTAIMRYFVGLTPQPTFDIHNVFEWQQAEEENYKSAEKDAIKNWHMAFQSMVDNDPEQAQKYLTRGFHVLDVNGVPEKMRTRFWAQANRSFVQPLTDSTFARWAIGPNVNTNDAKTRQDIYERTMRARGQ